MQENPAVDINTQEMGLDDAALNISTEQQPEGSTLESVLGAQQDQQPTQQDEQPKEKQAGWIQKRIQEGVQKQLQTALAEERARMKAEFDAQILPLRESALNREADELVSSGEFKSKERAMEYLRLKSGMPAPQEPEKPSQPPRNEKGQFTSQPTNAPDSTEQYGQMLIAQAKAIEAAGGPNVIEAYNTDPDIKRKVLSREWDFADVAGHLTGKNPANALPTPTRRPNGFGPSVRSIGDLSDEQFDHVQKYLERGGVIDMRQR